jgi:hypothetical protein
MQNVNMYIQCCGIADSDLDYEDDWIEGLHSADNECVVSPSPYGTFRLVRYDS